jgi:hypothetical protein
MLSMRRAVSISRRRRATAVARTESAQQALVLGALMVISIAALILL